MYDIYESVAHIPLLCMAIIIIIIVMEREKSKGKKKWKIKKIQQATLFSTSRGCDWGWESGEAMMVVMVAVPAAALVWLRAVGTSCWTLASLLPAQYCS